MLIVRYRAKNGLNALFKATATLGGFIGAGALPEDWARAQLEHVATDIGLDPIEIQRTIESGIRTGMQNPRDLSR